MGVRKQSHGNEEWREEVWCVAWVASELVARACGNGEGRLHALGAAVAGARRKGAFDGFVEEISEGKLAPTCACLLTNL